MQRRGSSAAFGQRDRRESFLLVFRPCIFSRWTWEDTPPYGGEGWLLRLPLLHPSHLSPEILLLAAHRISTTQTGCPRWIRRPTQRMDYPSRSLDHGSKHLSLLPLPLSPLPRRKLLPPTRVSASNEPSLFLRLSLIPRNMASGGTSTASSSTTLRLRDKLGAALELLGR